MPTIDVASAVQTECPRSASRPKREPLGDIDMDKSTTLFVAILALCLTSCAIPNRTGYSIAADHHEKFAQIAREGVTADEAAAQSFTTQGNRSAASHAEESASQFRRTYWVERFQADKDRWLSQWWPSL